MKNKKGLVSVAVGLGLMGFALAAPAHADTNDGVAGALVGVGSDTSQDVIEGFSTALDGVNPAGLTVTNPKRYVLLMMMMLLMMMTMVMIIMMDDVLQNPYGH